MLIRYSENIYLWCIMYEEEHGWLRLSNIRHTNNILIFNITFYNILPCSCRTIQSNKAQVVSCPTFQLPASRKLCSTLDQHIRFTCRHTFHLGPLLTTPKQQLTPNCNQLVQFTVICTMKGQLFLSNGWPFPPRFIHFYIQYIHIELS